MNSDNGDTPFNMSNFWNNFPSFDSSRNSKSRWRQDKTKPSIQERRIAFLSKLDELYKKDYANTIAKSQAQITLSLTGKGFSENLILEFIPFVTYHVYDIPMLIYDRDDLMAQQRLIIHKDTKLTGLNIFQVEESDIDDLNEIGFQYAFSHHKITDPDGAKYAHWNKLIHEDGYKLVNYHNPENVEAEKFIRRKTNMLIKFQEERHFHPMVAD